MTKNYRLGILHEAVPAGLPAAAQAGTTVNLSSYSPDPTGATSSSAAFAAAINAAGVNGTIIIGAGRFRISQPIIPKAGQTLQGQGIDTTIIQIQTAALGTAAFAGLAAIQGIAVTANGNDLNPGVTVRDLTVDGGRWGALWTAQGIADWNAAHPTELVDVGDVGTQVPDRHYDTTTCPDGNGQGISCKVGWTVERVRFTSINGFKCAAFGAHGTTIKDCVWDNDGTEGANTGNAGEKDQIGGGSGVIGLTIDGIVIMPNCVGSGIDITQGQEVVIRNSFIHSYTLILEGVQDFTIENNYIGPVGGVGGEKGGNQSINIKPNTQYRSSYTANYPTNTLPGAGAFMPKGGRIIGNTVVESTLGPGISVIYTNNGYSGFPFYCPGGGILIEGNTIISPERAGIAIVGNAPNGKVLPDIVRNNTIIDVIPLYNAGVQTTWTPGVGVWESCGIAIGIGSGDTVEGNTIIDTRTVSKPVIHGVSVGPNSVSNKNWVFEKTYASRNVGVGISGQVVYTP